MKQFYKSNNTTCPREGIFMNGSNQSKITDAVIKLVVDNPMVKVDWVDASMSLAELNVDSLEKLSIAMDLEDAFDLEITDQEVEEFSTVADIIALVEQILDDKAAQAQVQAQADQSDDDINHDSLDIAGLDSQTSIESQPTL